MSHSFQIQLDFTGPAALDTDGWQSRCKLRVTASHNHFVATKNAVPGIQEGDGMKHKHKKRNKSQRETLATRIGIQQPQKYQSTDKSLLKICHL